MESEKRRLFPIFIDISGKKVLVVGAGTIASRRIKTLLQFGPNVTVVAMECTPQIERWSNEQRVQLFERAFCEADLDGAELVIAATDNDNLNQQIYRECQNRHILVNVSSDQKLCDFHFPGVVLQEEITVGINASGQNHRKAKQARMAIEQCLQGEKIYE